MVAAISVVAGLASFYYTGDPVIACENAKKAGDVSMAIVETATAIVTGASAGTTATVATAATTATTATAATTATVATAATTATAATAMTITAE